ncbi:pleiotropic regulatory protein RsmS [Aliivibrio sp. S4TY2]|uniref:pleiotropic regulatory protein RsmS n=1 Tax=unclassified Aliivibrio TaxID=2645654 RepID=UPI00237873A1|nr:MULTISPECIES: pleiotropic regulatory protein RsmS [unclassified Aliivibrio]MDD9157498.1 pleiotropic regulatory protein RsmS [Aliivibrio sp. S4TY2]MDD9161308.1 pleiotropic regulatory protein RsmS [Aliivibrio sp. S4TY1]MDD9165338.1 pleiotropic regulatory protein RsmS [Aliivibrio sp. S4MY2]MDD9169407.1 pleiotropic regulatory protein RsmS [Aliivibrio sp. S4MY4]MDD9186400.1 pleiotropic regulatory protein RsmS [Aliivibrio sp. S4MY3]
METNVSIEQETPTSPLDNAPDEIKLAVDLIYLLESNKVKKEIAIKALEIVLNDFKNK